MLLSNDGFSKWYIYILLIPVSIVCKGWLLV